MKIVDFRTFVVANANPGKGGRYFIFVHLITDSGIVGLGEVYAASFGPHVFAKMIADVVERHVIGHNPFDIERLTRRIYGRGFSFRPDISLVGIISGLEMACWDIIGKECNKPVYALLGGRVHEKLRSYTYLYPPAGMGDEFYLDPDKSAEVAAQCVDQGFTAVKLDPAGPYSVFDGRQPALHVLSRCEEFMKKIRAAVGDKADILFGTHGQFSTSGAIRLAEVLQPYKPLWFEEPVPPDMPEEMAKVAARTTIPIATGERLCTRFEFQRVLQTGAASILQMDLGRSGGLLESKKIAGMAETYYAHIAPHMYCGPVVGAANIQLATCSPNFLILESIGKLDGFYADLLETPLTWEDGYVIPPETPGLGVVLNEKVAEQHPYVGDRLHLEMTENPMINPFEGD